MSPNDWDTGSGPDPSAASLREQGPLHVKRLDKLQALVAIHTEEGEWETFVALLKKIGADVTPSGVRYVE